jgi:hypothetical protein
VIVATGPCEASGAGEHAAEAITEIQIETSRHATVYVIAEPPGLSSDEQCRRVGLERGDRPYAVQEVVLRSHVQERADQAAERGQRRADLDTATSGEPFEVLSAHAHGEQRIAGFAIGIHTRETGVLPSGSSGS